jgi:hypothetical protein
MMMFFNSFFIFLVGCKLCKTQVATIKLREPADLTIFAIKKLSEKVSALVRYDVANLTSDLQLCMELLDTINQELLLPSTCFPAIEGSETKTLTDLPIGSFALSLVLKDANSFIDESKVTSNFNVKKVEELLPEIKFMPGVIKSVIEEKEGKYSVVKTESDRELVV